MGMESLLVGRDDEASSEVERRRSRGRAQERVGQAPLAEPVRGKEERR